MLKIILVTPEFPYPIYDGVKIPVWNRILALSSSYELNVFVSQSKASLTLEQNKVLSQLKNVNFFFDELFLNDTYFFRLLKFFITGLPFFATNSINSIGTMRLKNLIIKEKYSHVIIDTEKFSVLIDQLPVGPIYIISPNDSIALSYLDELKYRNHNLFHLIFTFINYKRAKKFESLYYPRFDYCQLVSLVDSDYLEKLNKNIKTLLCPIGINIKKNIKNSIEYFPPYILIVGRLSGGNLDYVERFIKNIWSNFTKIYPLYQLVLVSRIVPSNFEEKYNKMNICIKSEIDDSELGLVYLNSICVISPVRKSSGMLNKIIEAMSFGKLVIGYDLSFKCMPNALNGLHFLSVKDDVEMLSYLYQVIENKVDFLSIGKFAKNYVDSNLSWDFILNDYKSFLNKSTGLHKYN